MTLIVNAQLVNEGKITQSDVLIKNGRIDKIDGQISPKHNEKIIDAKGQYLFPGLIDDQVHFREPGLTHKGNIYTESKAAVAGGITSYMEMPNTSPITSNIHLLEEKFHIASQTSLANYSFYLGATNDNLEELLKVNTKNVCGIKVFMGSSTGNLLVDNPKTLEGIFKNSPMLIATHCEDENLMKRNAEIFIEKYAENIPAYVHPLIRNAQVCYNSSSFAKSLAEKYGTRLHILHISTGIETSLFVNNIPLKDKKITAEACIHHLWFSDEDYQEKGFFIKWNPAIKTTKDRQEIWKALLDNRIDVIATDHAPHTIEEKKQTYFKAPSGGPLVQHSLQALLDFYKQGKISLEKIAEKTSHNPSIIFKIAERGYIREGYWADLVLVDLNKPYKVEKSNILYKCGWSPFEGHTFSSTITHTFVSGHLAFQNGVFDESVKGKRLVFDR
ncbi:MAG: dihydroorotase [Flammeovirgaceae bacterium]